MFLRIFVDVCLLLCYVHLVIHVSCLVSVDIPLCHFAGVSFANARCMVLWRLPRVTIYHYVWCFHLVELQTGVTDQ